MKLRTNLIRLFAHISRRRRWQLVGLVALMLVGALAEMATLGAVIPFLALLSDPTHANKYPLLNKVFEWFGGPPDHELLAAAILFALIALAAGMIRMLLMWTSLRISYGLGADIGGEVYRRTLYQPYSWHVSRNSSEIISGIDKVNAVVSGIINPLAQGAVAFIFSLGILAMLLAIDPQTALIAGIGFSILYGLTTLILRRKLLQNGQIISANVGRRVQAVQEGLGGIRDVLLSGTQPIYHRRFVVVDHAIRRSQATNALIGASPRYIIEAAGMAFIAALAYWLAGRPGGLTGAIPVLGALTIGAQQLLPQMQLVYFSWSSINGTRNHLTDVLALLDRPIPAEDAHPMPLTIRSAESQPNDPATPLIALRKVSFRYRPDLPEVLSEVSLEIPRGARIGIVGKTGSGKSTLVDLILGLLEPSAGQIEVDGQLLGPRNRRVWQSRIAHVPQSIYLSDASIAENIAFGVPAPEVNHALVTAAAKLAQVEDFIQSLPDRYQTPVGERGIRLSGGQRQRIGIARAFYKPAEVIVLDEATSALDNGTEQNVMRAIEASGRNQTLLIIAHRLTTLKHCTQIIELRSASIQSIPGPDREPTTFS